MEGMGVWPLWALGVAASSLSSPVPLPALARVWMKCISASDPLTCLILTILKMQLSAPLLGSPFLLVVLAQLA